MPNPLNNVAATGSFTDACSVQDVFGGRGGTFQILDGPVFYQLEYGIRGESYWTDEAYTNPGAGAIEAGAIGIRFRNASSVTATCSARIAPKAQPIITITSTTAVTAGELAYAEFTATVTANAVAEAAALSLVTVAPLTFDGSTIVLVEFGCDAIATGGAGASGGIDLFDGGASIGRLFDASVVAMVASSVPVGVLRRRFTPSSGSHTFSARLWNPAAVNMLAVAGLGGANVAMPGWLRVSA